MPKQIKLESAKYDVCCKKIDIHGRFEAFPLDALQGSKRITSITQALHFIRNLSLALEASRWFRLQDGPIL